VALSDITADSVLQAIREHDRIGRDEFLKKYGFGPARSYHLHFHGGQYDSGAIAGAAHGYLPGQAPLTPDEFSGGYAHVAKRLSQLGFDISGQDATPGPPPMESGRDYSWAELGDLFGFKESYLGAAGGMISRPAHDAVLIITHPGGAKSFDYGDYWENDRALIYAGRGKTGDQKLEGQNRDVAENRRAIMVFEPAGPRTLRFLGRPTCVGHWLTQERDSNGELRSVIRLRLVFDESVASASDGRRIRGPRPNPERVARPFDPSAVPTPPSVGATELTPEEIAAKHEKANSAHHQILVALHRFLVERGWSEIEEIPGALDLRATKNGTRVIFEAKGLVRSNHLARCRSALSQLLEYRFFHGKPEDRLCLVVNGLLPDRRIRFLESAGIAVATIRDGQVRAAGVLCGGLLEKST
jgi:hypothetical protein